MGFIDDGFYKVHDKGEISTSERNTVYSTSKTKTALKILLNSGAKVDYVVDNNPLYLEKKVDNFSIKSPYFLKKNINKFFDYNIFICNKKNSVFGQIKLQLKNIGFENKNIIHFNM